jgi:Tol biopolymer transport system component
MEQLLDTTAIQGASFSADESRILFSSNKTGIWNAYTIPVGGGAWTAVTKSTKDSTYAVSFFPNDNRILITRDQGGNELNHLYVLGEDGAERDLTPGAKLKAQFVKWSPDGTAFFVISNERDARFFDIYRYDAKSYERAMFFENKDGYQPSSVSDDANWVSLEKPTTTNDSDIYLWNAASKETKHISTHAGNANYESSGFDRASKYLYFVTDAGRRVPVAESLRAGRRRRQHRAEGRMGRRLVHVLAQRQVSGDHHQRRRATGRLGQRRSERRCGRAADRAERWRDRRAFLAERIQAGALGRRRSIAGQHVRARRRHQEADQAHGHPQRADRLPRIWSMRRSCASRRATG